MDVADFAEDDGSKNFANPGNRMEGAIKLVIKTTDLFPKLRQLTFQKIDLGNELTQLKSLCFTSQFDAK